MLKQVREPCAARPLVLRAHVIHDVDGHHRCGAVPLHDDPQPVIKRLFLQSELDDLRFHQLRELLNMNIEQRTSNIER